MRIAFASISLIIDFDSKEEAEQYKLDNFGKHWWFGEIVEMDKGSYYCMEVRRPYKDYNCGW